MWNLEFATEFVISVIRRFDELTVDTGHKFHLFVNGLTLQPHSTHRVDGGGWSMH